MRSKKYILMLPTLLFIILSLLLVSCTPSTPPEETVSKKPLYFRITWPDYSGRGNAIKAFADEFNQTYSSDYEIQILGGDENMTDITSMLQDNERPMIYALPYRLVKYYGEMDSLTDLSDLFSTSSDNFYPEIWKLGKVDDQVYGIPWLGHSICLIYNMDLVKAANIDLQALDSLDALVSALEAIETSTQAKGIGLVGADHNDVSWMVNQFIYAFGSKLVDDQGKQVVINTPRTVEAIRFYKDTLGHYAQATWHDDTGVEVMNYFREGKIAFEFQGIWGVTDIDKNIAPFEIGVIPLTQIGLKPEVGPIMLSISKDMPEDMKSVSIDFINYLISPESQKKVFKGEYSPEHDAYYPFRVPMRKDIAESMTSSEYTKYLPFLSGFNDPSIDVPVSKWQIIKEEYYQPGLHKVLNSELSINDFLDQIENEGNKILNP